MRWVVSACPFSSVEGANNRGKGGLGVGGEYEHSDEYAIFNRVLPARIEENCVVGGSSF